MFNITFLVVAQIKISQKCTHKKFEDSFGYSNTEYQPQIINRL